MMGELKMNVNWKVQTEEYTTYEFTTAEDVFVEEADSEFDLFRLFINKDGSTEIFVANNGDYDIHEDVTGLFDNKGIRYFCETASVPDVTEDYLAHYEN
jgi:hypothetical protein